MARDDIVESPAYSDFSLKYKPVLVGKRYGGTNSMIDPTFRPINHVAVVFLKNTNLEITTELLFLFMIM